MQTKLLPSIQELKQKVLQKVLKGKKAKKKEKEQLQDQNLSPNLLTPIETKSFLMKASPKIAITTRNLVYVTAVVFSVLSVTNFVLQNKLNIGVEKRDELIETIKKNSYVEDQVRGISGATKLYKDIKNQNLEVSYHLRTLVGVLEGTVTANSISFNRDKKYYEINASTNKATAYTTMITKLLDNEYIESMTIEFVDYKPQTNEYTADFKVELK